MYSFKACVVSHNLEYLLMYVLYNLKLFKCIMYPYTEVTELIILIVHDLKFQSLTVCVYFPGFHIDKYFMTQSCVTGYWLVSHAQPHPPSGHVEGVVVFCHLPPCTSLKKTLKLGYKLSYMDWTQFLVVYGLPGAPH